MTRDEFMDLVGADYVDEYEKAQLSQEDATIVAKSKRTFVELLVHYPHPDACTYPEYKGKPYYSIKYIEDGECFVGFGTYKPEVLSQYLRDYFMPPAQPEITEEAVKEYCRKRCLCVVDGALLKKYASAQPEQRWIPCSERLPENRVSVIVCFREWQQYAKRYVYSIVVGWYARKHSVHENVFSDWEADCEYDEIEDEYYIEEGWYEFTTQGNGDLMNWYINADVIAWMPLPEPYKEGEMI